MNIKNFTTDELDTMYNNDKVMIIAGYSAYQLFYSVNAGYYIQKVYTFKDKQVKNGRHFKLTTEEYINLRDK